MTVASSAVHPLVAYRDEFPIFERQIYLNSCSLGALSRRSRRWVDRFLHEWQECGAARWYDRWWERLATLHQGYARVVGARPGDCRGGGHGPHPPGCARPRR